MHCRFRNVALLLLVLALATGLAVAQSGKSPDPRIPALYSTSGNPLVTPTTPREEFEGPNTADFFNSINNPQAPNAALMANPQIAVGPDEIVMVVNTQIWRLPNGNAMGNIPTGLYPGSVLIGGQPFGAQRASLDNWIGEAALAVLCPTGNTSTAAGVLDPANTRSSISCQIDNATTTYDQMHGRFLVLFTVVDTGLTFDQTSSSYKLTRPRKASWVLVVSRFGVLIDQACHQGTEAAASCPAPPVPNSQQNAAGSFAFVTPTPPGGSNTGGVNGNNWYIYYGNDLTALGSDKFGSLSSSGAGGWVGDVGVGNINTIAKLQTATANAAVFGCNPADVYAAGTFAPAGGGTAKVCYMPTGARIGVDNDTVTLVSPVLNANISGGDLGIIFQPTAGATFQTPGFAGNRVRVIKKTALYANANVGATSATGKALALGNQFAATLSGATGAGNEYYDLYTSATGAIGTPVTNNSVLAGGGAGAAGPPIPYTVLVNDVACTAGGSPAVVTDAAGLPVAPVGAPAVTAPCRMSPIFYEPAHLRGRAQATFSNLAIAGGGPAEMSHTYLVGAISSPWVSQGSLYVQGIEEFVSNIIPTGNTFGPIPFFPVLTGITGNCTVATGTASTVPTALNQQGIPCKAPIPGFFMNPTGVRQQNFRASGDTPGDGAVAPNIYVGDDRPHNVIFREGYLYDARVIAPVGDVVDVWGVGPTAFSQSLFAAASLSTTTKYEILQKLCGTNSGGVCPVPFAPVQLNGDLTAGSTTIANLSGGGTTVLAPGMQVTCVTAGCGIPANDVIQSLSPDGTTKTLVMSLPATISGKGVALNFFYANTGAAPTLTYQQMWQNTNAYAPMFDVPANVITFGVGTPFNALNFLEKLFVATTVPPLAGLPDTMYGTAPSGVPGGFPAIVTSAMQAQLTALTSDFVSGAPDPRTRETFGSTGLTPVQLPARANCFSNQLSPGGPINGEPNSPYAYGSLFDTRCGTDVTDSNPQIKDPFSGLQYPSANNSATAIYPAFGPSDDPRNPQAAYTIRGGEGIDPNDGSLWNFGAYAMRRDASFTALAHWGTFAANYKMSFPTTDVYGNSTVLFSDIAGIPEQGFIQIAVNNGLTPALVNAQGIPLAPPNSQSIPFVSNQVYTGTTIGQAPAAGTFGINDLVTRREMAYWIVKSTMDENAITFFLCNSVSLTGVTGCGTSAASFADVPYSDAGWRYIEVMARKGWTSGCAAGVARRYCPDYITTRRDLAAFMIRAKFGNVFQSVLSGCTFGFVNGTTGPGTAGVSSLFPPEITTNCSGGGDNFGLFVTGLPYFADNPSTTGNDWYVFVQKMRELRITNGTFLGPNSDGRNGTYAAGYSIYSWCNCGAPPATAAQADATLGGLDLATRLTRRQIVTFMVRGFFL